MTGLDAQSVLSAMISPAVPISACGSLIIATVSPLNRAVDRTRETSQRFAELAEPRAVGAATDEERRVLFVHESRLALQGLDAEMDYVCQRVKEHAAPELLELPRAASGPFFRRR